MKTPRPTSEGKIASGTRLRRSSLGSGKRMPQRSSTSLEPHQAGVRRKHKRWPQNADGNTNHPTRGSTTRVSDQNLAFWGLHSKHRPNSKADILKESGLWPPKLGETQKVGFGQTIFAKTPELFKTVDEISELPTRPSFNDCFHVSQNYSKPPMTKESIQNPW